MVIKILMNNPYLIEIDYVYGPEDRERIRRFILPDYCSLNKQKLEVYYLTIRRSGGTTCRENRMFRKIFQGKEMGSLEEVTAGFLALCRNVESGVFEDVFKLEIDPKAKQQMGGELVAALDEMAAIHNCRYEPEPVAKT